MKRAHHFISNMILNGGLYILGFVLGSSPVGVSPTKYDLGQWRNVITIQNRIDTKTILAMCEGSFTVYV